MTRDLNNSELTLIGSLLMGAAHADGSIDGAEANTVYDILNELLGDTKMPDDVRDHLQKFAPAAFDLKATCEALHVHTPEDRRAMLGLISMVTDADDVHTLEEDHYLRRAAAALGSEPGELDGLVIDMEEIRQVLPPPVPGK
jgi:uncharacterized tellurite resistance protein B-like protein